MQLRKRKRGFEEEMGAPEEKEEGTWKRKWMHLRKMKRGLGRGNGCT
jgi:hypothetical protein